MLVYKRYFCFREREREFCLYSRNHCPHAEWHENISVNWKKLYLYLLTKSGSFVYNHIKPESMVLSKILAPRRISTLLGVSRVGSANFKLSSWGYTSQLKSLAGRLRVNDLYNEPSLREWFNLSKSGQFADSSLLINFSQCSWVSMNANEWI